MKFIPDMCFIGLQNLLIIQIEYNDIACIKSRAFQHLGNVTILDISNNKLLFLQRDTFYKVNRIYILNLQNNPLTEISLEMFSGVNIRILVSNYFYICCITLMDTTCTAKIPWYASCSHLLPNIETKVTFIIVSLGIVSGNSLSILKNIMIRNKRLKGEIYSIIVCAINMGDILCGSYILVLWIGDLYYSDEFIINDTKWKYGMACSVAFWFLLMFSLSVPHLLCVLSLGRLIVVVHPMTSKFRSVKFVFTCICGGTVLPAILILLSIIHLNIKKIMTTDLCSPFIDPTHSVAEIKIMALTVALFQFLAICFIGTMYVLLARLLITNAVQSVATSKVISKRVLIQLLLVTAFNLVGWFPSSVIFIFSLFLSKYPTDLLVWTTIALFPINSIINPFVFILFEQRRLTSYKETIGKYSKWYYTCLLLYS